MAAKCEENIPTGHHALQELAYEQPSPTLDNAGQQLLFSYLQICNLPMSTLPRWPKLWPNLGQSEEEEGSNQMLPQPFHPMLAELDEKHPTRCATVAVHWLLRRAAFKTNISQNKVAEKFWVAPKKLHETIMGQKCDPG